MDAVSISKQLKCWMTTRFSNAWRNEIFIHQKRAIYGYDPVAFFSEGKMVFGSIEFTYSWGGGLWFFSDLTNKKCFEAEPEKYAPQYGGFCAFGVAGGYKAHTDITTWIIIQNKLYFSYNKKIRVTWERNLSELIKEADRRWINVKKTPVKYILPILTLLNGSILMIC